MDFDQSIFLQKLLMYVQFLTTVALFLRVQQFGKRFVY